MTYYHVSRDTGGRGVISVVIYRAPNSTLVHGPELLPRLVWLTQPIPTTSAPTSPPGRTCSSPKEATPEDQAGGAASTARAAGGRE
jgi:hypothetical protein